MVRTFGTGSWAFHGGSDEFIQYWLKHDLNWRTEVINFTMDPGFQGHQLFIATNQDHIRGNHIKKQEILGGTFASTM